MSGYCKLSGFVRFVLCFDEKVASLMEQIRHNLNETQKLLELRDTLLPRLLSGELQIKDVEQTAKVVI